MKFLMINTHPVNYHVPIYQALAKESDIDLDVAFLWNVFSAHYQPTTEWPIQYEPHLLEGYNSFFLRNYSLRRRGFLEFVNWGVVPLILSGKYQAVFLFGYNHLTAWLVAISCRLKGIPLIFKGEGDLSLQRNRVKRVLKQVYLKIFFKFVNYFTYSYQRNADYFLHYGVPPGKLYFMPCSVNNEYLQKLLGSWDKELLRAELGFSSKKIILFVGRLETRKNPEVLLDAFKMLNEINDALLVYVGEGSLAKNLQQKCAEDKFLRENVIFAGFRQQNDVYRYLMAADVLVLPSVYDPSPKVINEAMNFSLPVLVSSRVGTSGDLVIEGRNGFLFEPTDSEALRIKLETILTDNSRRIHLGKQAAETVKSWSVSDGLECIKKILKQIGSNDNE